MLNFYLIIQLDCFHFRESIERCSALYSELQRAIVKLVRLADKRLKKLEQCLQLRNLEEETTQVRFLIIKVLISLLFGMLRITIKF